MLLDETPLFEPSLLQELDWSGNTASFSPPVSPSSPGEGLVLRPLCMADFNRGETHSGAGAPRHKCERERERENDSFLLLSAVFQDSSKFCLNSPRQVTSHLSCSQVGLFLSQTFTCIMSTADVPVSSNSYRPVYDFRLSFRKV